MRHKILLGLSIIWLLSSCDDFLEVEPEFQISINQQLSTKSGVISALRGSYDLLNETFLSERTILYGDIQVGNIAFAPVISDRVVTPITSLEDVYDFNDFAEDSNMEPIYATAYELIANVNQILVFVDALSDATQDEKDQIKAECYGLRAYTLFRLAQLYVQPFGFTPNNTHPGLVVSEVPLIVGEDFPARATAAATFDFIERDIQRALDNQRNLNLTALGDRSSLRTQTLRALYADFALWTQDWETAFQQSNQVITSSGIDLITSPGEYVDEFTNAGESSETIFTIPIRFDPDGDVSFDASRFFRFSSLSSYARITASGDLRAMFEPNDVRGTSLLLEVQIPTNSFGITSDQSYFYTQKYQADKGYMAYRMGEMYLIRAEANARLANLDFARSDLNQIKVRAGVTPLPTNDNLLQEIWDERRRELAFEGKSFFDFLRTGRNIVRTQDCIADRCNANFPDPKFVLPIPNRTLILNPNLVQNESY